MLKILVGDCLERLKELGDETVHCCVTSPPYWGLRDYGVAGQLGLEKTPEEYVAKMVAVFREVRRVLRKDGTCWMNLGDCYANAASGGDTRSGFNARYFGKPIADGKQAEHGKSAASARSGREIPCGLKPKDLVGIPWRVAFALQADGWYLRSDIIWHKPNPMPESVTDRPTKAHEYIFLLSKSQRYYYDAKAIKEPSIDPESLRPEGRSPRGDDKFAKAFLDENRNGMARTRDGFSKLEGACYPTKNKRTVWTVPSQPYPESHFATFPEALIKPCILAGCKAGGTVLDPFGGSGTTGMVALELGRSAILIELNPEYVKLIEQRTNVTPGLQLT